jgi:hypothetical protein
MGTTISFNQKVDLLHTHSKYIQNFSAVIAVENHFTELPFDGFEKRELEA